MGAARSRWIGLLAAGCLLGGCGGGGGGGGHGGHDAGTRTATTPPAAVSGRVSGAEVFTRDCLYCHSLSGHNAPSQQGGDLRDLHTSRRQMVELTAEMPRLHGPLTPAQLNAVVEYVMAVERRVSPPG